MVGYFSKVKSIWWFSCWNNLWSFLELFKSVKTWTRIWFIWLKVYFHNRFPWDRVNGFSTDLLEIIPSMWTLFKNIAPLLLAKATVVLNKLNENDTLVNRKAINRAKSVYDKLSAGCYKNSLWSVSYIACHWKVDKLLKWYHLAYPMLQITIIIWIYWKITPLLTFFSCGVLSKLFFLLKNNIKPNGI